MKAVRWNSLVLFLFLLAFAARPAGALGSSPAAFGKLNPAHSTLQPLDVILRWQLSSSGAVYSYCIQPDSSFCDPVAHPENWIGNGHATTITPSGLSLGQAYYWQVRAGALLGGTTYADGAWTAGWWFTTAAVPGSFYKSTPLDGNGDQPANTTLTWMTASNADYYEYCYDTLNNETCEGTWTSAGANTSVTLSGLSVNTMYYWQVRAVNTLGSTEADAGDWWYFVTRAPVTATVTNANDSGPGSLRQAVADAASGDTINFAGPYTIYLESSLSIDKQLTIDATGHPVTLSGDSGGDGSPNVRVLEIGPQGVVTLNLVNVVSGLSPDYGGGIYNQGSLTASLCVVTGNSTTAGWGGGGLYNASGATAVFARCAFSHNTTLYSGGGILNRGNLTLTETSLYLNSTTTTTPGSGIGGAIVNDNAATLVIERGVLSQNTAGNAGGAIDNWGTLTITETTFSDNTANGANGGGGGGGIHNSGPMTIQGSLFSGNTTEERGGAILDQASGNLSVTNSTFYDNSARFGGAIELAQHTGTGLVTNSTFSANHASQSGGGVFGTSLSTTLQNSILAGNTAAGFGLNCVGAFTDGGHNLSWPAESHQCPGTETDPQLGPLENNGGYTMTLALPPGSPAVDASNDNCPAVDQRGIARPQGSLCDVGAYELVRISGHVTLNGTGLDGVTFTIADDCAPRGVSSDPAGSYIYPLATCFNAVDGWGGSITPSKTGYTFSPDHRDYVAVKTSQTGQDYTAWLNPGTFAKSGPADGGVLLPTGITLGWETSSAVVSYEYCLNTAASCPGPWTATTATSVALPAQATGLYYWQVRAVNGPAVTEADGGAWHSFSALPPPGAFSKSTPANNATGQLNALTLSWSASSDASSYDVCTTQTLPCSSWTSTGSARTLALSGLTPGKKYYWQVRANNANGTTYANSGNRWVFIVSPMPGVFRKLSPANGVANRPTTLTLKWSASLSAGSYEYCLSTTTTCSSWTSAGTARSIALTSLLPGRKYYWQVRAHNAFGYTYANGGVSSRWSFTIAPLPGPFNKSAPANNALNQPASLTLSWGASSHASSYEYCLSTTTTCSSWTSTGTARSTALTGLLPGRKYYWQVRARNGSGYTYANGPSVWWSFTVK